VKSESNSDLKNKTLDSRLKAEQSEAKPEHLCEQTGVLFDKKNKTPVISRSFNHQSKNEQLIRPSLLISRKLKVKNHTVVGRYDF
jgi:hypothetical protein